MDEALSAMSYLGGCLAQRKSRQSLAYLSTEPGTEAEMAALNKLIGTYTACLPFSGRMRIDPPQLRGAIAQAFYKRTVRAPLPALPAPTPALTAMSPDDLDRLGRDAIIDRYASCVAATQPAFVHQLLTGSRLGSKDEAEAIGRMAQALEACLPRGSKLGLQPHELRLAIAAAAHQRLGAAAR